MLLHFDKAIIIGFVIHSVLTNRKLLCWFSIIGLVYLRRRKNYWFGWLSTRFCLLMPKAIFHLLDILLWGRNTHYTSNKTTQTTRENASEQKSSRTFLFAPLILFCWTHFLSRIQPMMIKCLNEWKNGWGKSRRHLSSWLPQSQNT